MFAVFIFVVFDVGGLLHVHHFADFTIEGFVTSLFGHVSVVVSLGHVVIGGNANTIQFPPYL